MLSRSGASRIALVAIAAGAAWLDWVDIGTVGLGNTYYATAVRSMLTSPHALLFASFDPAGFVSVDKPPLGLWLQVASAALFGFAGPALILPSAIAGVIAVALLGVVVRWADGSAAGLLAAAALAVTPVSVVVARDDLLDGPLVAVCMAAVVACFVATRTARPWPVLLAAMCVGLAFNIKFLDAYLVVPPIVLAYLLGAPGSRRRRAIVLAGSGLLLVVVSGAWIAFVDLTPADQRPYVGSTRTDSAFELALGYDGLQRLLGHPSTEPTTVPTTSITDPAAGTSATPDETSLGPPGPLRLLEPQLGGQVGWFVPLALIGLASGAACLPWGAWRRRRRPPLSRHQTAIVLFGGWFITAAAFFSVAAFFSPYYLAILAPPVAALAGDGAVAAWRAYGRAGPGAWLLPLAILTSGLEAWVILGGEPGWLPWLGPLAAGTAACAALVLGYALVARTWRGRLARRGRLALALALSVVVSGPPLLWTMDSLRAANEGSHPLAGPSRTGASPAAVPTLSQALLRYLVAHRGGTS
ncbi:MAG TPA: glycosyltransferase family 39 protein, partial [Candidatus Sulfotelmatobacter sp.]|nr:glycosyltransferase family 39 protein [Candidatus Sulfotelmatobacter sp.]